jgi:hypothetical protein
MVTAVAPPDAGTGVDPPVVPVPVPVDVDGGLVLGAAGGATTATSIVAVVTWPASSVTVATSATLWPSRPVGGVHVVS